ncbi:MAG: outer membrane beta-barrel protein [Cytophagaceae bacterium]
MKRIKFTLLLFLVAALSYAQDQEPDTLKFSALEKSKLSFFLDDTYILGGIATSSVYYSNNFRELGYSPGYVFGVEQYLPLGGKSFLSSGLNISQRNFSYSRHNPTRFNNLYLDIPVSTAWELPVLRNLDLRLLIGALVGVRLNSQASGNYGLLTANPQLFNYNVDDFHRIDFGWTFGLSAEYRNVLFRLRSYSGFIKIDRKDQGMLNSFNFEIGYFLFRSLNSRKL